MRVRCLARLKTTYSHWASWRPDTNGSEVHLVSPCDLCPGGRIRKIHPARRARPALAVQVGSWQSPSRPRRQQCGDSVFALLSWHMAGQVVVNVLDDGLTELGLG